ncbi:TadE family type IV pilus minor pilin [Actinokineospora iranica]|uniref:TadE-like protein n=1 Tax=Actinokineospora iranica TaxID=1271860 RepID=A0A1G6XXH7_9PSEU|nr:TadE family type IV pilus minor pilin [Actinokineospora iranica]SDD82105.1 TadE-like protein [Actinokineospora iranica]
MRPPRDRGAVTVEAAIAVGVLVLVIAMGIAGVGAVADQIRCVDAAREAARLAARGEPERGRAAAVAIAPRGAAVDIQVAGDTVSVAVRAEPVGGLLPGIEVSADAYAVAEPGVAP